VDWLHFGLARPAFRPAVDTDSYFPAASHEAALAAVAAGFARRDPVVLLDGPPGTGKSLVARKWLEQLLPEVPRVVVPNVHAARPADLLQAMLFDLSQPYQGLAEQELRLAVTGQLLQASDSSGYPTVLLIDDAQQLTDSALEELRLLGNVETRHGAALFVLLVAQPTLRAALGRPACEPFAQRVAVRAAVEPLTPEESAAYLRHQMAAAGGDPAAVLDDGAVSQLAGACGGVPRVLNQAAALAAGLAAEAGAELIDVEAALEALTRLGLEAPQTDESEEPVVLPHPATAAEPAPAAGSVSGSVGEVGNRHEPAAARGPKQKAARKRTA
jgi:type II secretory pathway predicted ATPase ExeA